MMNVVGHEILTKAAENTGMARFRIAAFADVAMPTLDKALDEKQLLTLKFETLEKLCAYLGIGVELRFTSKPKEAKAA